MIGITLAHYRITGKLGAGGMGEVWRAEDEKLGREVALKVLPGDFAEDPDRLARFEREAKVLASLNHPNIATLFGLETVTPGSGTGSGTGSNSDSDARSTGTSVGEGLIPPREIVSSGTGADDNSKFKIQNSKLTAPAITFLVMELVEGEDLSERISRGPIPIDEAIPIALQIAEALEAAHEAGIVHRDLKPANIKLRPDGTVKVLDFGLAKAWETDSTDASLSLSPTLTQHATAAGVILGTAAYMSPEQAAGTVADRRADIWGFGVVLWEMLTGNKLFSGETVSHVLASVLKDEVDLDGLPGDTPLRLRRLIERCLQKKPKQRLQAIGDARIVLEEYLADPDAFMAGSEPADAEGRSEADRTMGWWQTAAAVVVTAMVVGVLGWFMAPDTPERQLRKLEVPTEGVPDKALLSPDGRHLAYISGDQLWLRDLQRLESRAVPRSEGVMTLFWSDDGRWLAFGTGKKIWKVPAEGSDPVMVAVASDDFDWASGGAWIGDRIFFVTGDTGVFEVTARGGDPNLVLAPGEKEEDFHHPSALPEGKGLIFVVHGEKGYNSIDVWADGERRQVVELDGQNLESPIYSPTGHILFGRRPDNPGIWAVPFDLDRLEATGEPFLAAADASWPSAAADGTLAYISGSSILAPAQFVWVDREGRELEPISQPGSFWPVHRLSPDGRKIVAPTGDAGEFDLWIVDTERGTQTRLTFEEGSELWSAWTRDGSQIAYRGNVGDERGIAIRLADGTREPELLLDTGSPSDFSPDGRLLLYTALGDKTHRDLWIADIEGGGEPVPFVQTDASEGAGKIDPGGRYAAYISDESGRPEVYIRSFPDAGGKWQVSVDGGFWPKWNPQGGELFFAQDRQVMAVDVETEPSLRLGTPRVLFTMPLSGRSFGSSPDQFAVAPDGERFVVLRSSGAEAEETRPPSVIVIDSWLSEFEEAE